MRICARTDHGSALLIALITGLVMTLALASYLTLIQNQTKATYRSLTWNSGIAVAEAGIEEALTQINLNGTNLVANNGWELVQTKYLMKTRTVGGQSCIVGISTNVPPVIVAEGQVKTSSGDQTVSRIVKVGTRYSFPWRYALLAQKSVNMNGNNIAVDSYDSDDPNYSTDGRYDSTKRKDNGTVATNSRDPNMLTAGNADIWGKLATGPGGLAGAGPNSVVGNMTWHSAGSSGIQPGAATDDVNVSFFPVDAPSLSSFSPGGGTVGGTNYDYVFSSGDWVLSGSKKLTGKVIVTGHARVLVSSDVSLSGQDFIYIAPGANLELYVSAPSTSIGGNGILNSNSRATDFLYYGLPTNTSVSFSGNASVTGAIYAPNADLTLNGGGNNTYDLAGSVVSKSISMNGHFNFHYDEALGRIPSSKYIVDTWDEIKQTWDQILASGTSLLQTQ